jgi:type II secretory pathway component PulF
LQCIYDHIKVPEIKKRGRRFNTAYWTYDENVEDTGNLAESFNRVEPVIRKKQAIAEKLTVQTTVANPNR